MGELEREKRIRLKSSMQHILGLEEEEWRLQSRALWLKEGDNNTSYFHKVANQRRHSNLIDSLLVGEATVSSTPGGNRPYSGLTSKIRSLSI
ncbi:hypothetical protein QJS10_CPB13g00799 [Acorus calamus]|uniref:Uncharacterized protein n=1 Tax=Acorus calamus TaxID=4465 RepID=A0AAV9DIC1_ACOCL|nr:hypothetical protein QJS10_CPB13g00799 [Acorus calamus]